MIKIIYTLTYYMALVNNFYLQKKISIHLILKNNNFCSSYFIKLNFTYLFVKFTNLFIKFTNLFVTFYKSILNCFKKNFVRLTKKFVKLTILQTGFLSA